MNAPKTFVVTPEDIARAQRRSFRRTPPTLRRAEPFEVSDGENVIPRKAYKVTPEELQQAMRDTFRKQPPKLFRLNEIKDVTDSMQEGEESAEE